MPLLAVCAGLSPASTSGRARPSGPPVRDHPAR